jgi:hypothetical protein
MFFEKIIEEITYTKHEKAHTFIVLWNFTWYVVVLNTKYIKYEHLTTF